MPAFLNVNASDSARACPAGDKSGSGGWPGGAGFGGGLPGIGVSVRSACRTTKIVDCAVACAAKTRTRQTVAARTFMIDCLRYICRACRVATHLPVGRIVASPNIQPLYTSHSREGHQPTDVAVDLRRRILVERRDTCSYCGAGWLGCSSECGSAERKPNAGQQIPDLHFKLGRRSDCLGR